MIVQFVRSFIGWSGYGDYREDTGNRKTGSQWTEGENKVLGGGEGGGRRK